MKPALLSALALASSAAIASPVEKRSTVLIPSDVFSSVSTFEQYFSYNYPWGDTHNGAAIMSKPYVTIANNILTETAVHTGASKYAYNSGTVYTKQHFSVPTGGGLDFTADFIAPIAKGTWPAFWLTATSGWPPEIDIAEWKGDGKISFNTFNTSSQVSAHDVNYPNAGTWHTVKAELRDVGDGSTMKIDFFLDGAQACPTEHGRDYIGKTFNFIIDLQMEGSSGSPGPTTNTTYQIRNLNVTQI